MVWAVLRNSIHRTGLFSSCRNQSIPFGWSLANFVCFKKVRQNLGLDRCHFQMTGAAPANNDTLAFFMSVNLPLYEIYGMSETTGKGCPLKNSNFGGWLKVGESIDTIL